MQYNFSFVVKCRDEFAIRNRLDVRLVFVTRPSRSVRRRLELEKMWSSMAENLHVLRTHGFEICMRSLKSIRGCLAPTFLIPQCELAARRVTYLSYLSLDRCNFFRDYSLLFIYVFMTTRTNTKVDFLVHSSEASGVLKNWSRRHVSSVRSTLSTGS